MFWAFETVLRVSVAIAMTLIVAYATYRLVEVPGRMWLRRTFARWIAAVFGDVPARAPARAAPVREAAE
jgi:peptidoglycan/LPS O-acetylase OafA/YrhL